MDSISEGRLAQLAKALDEDSFDVLDEEGEVHALSDLMIAIFQLSDVLEMLREVPAIRGRLGKLSTLREELANAILGASGPISMQGRRAKGHPPMRMRSAFRMISAGVAIELLSRDLGEAKAAAREALEIWRSIAGEDGPSIALKTLEDWHSKVVHDPRLHRASVRETFTRHEGGNLRENAKQLIRRAVNLS